MKSFAKRCLFRTKPILAVLATVGLAASPALGVCGAAAQAGDQWDGVTQQGLQREQERLRQQRQASQHESDQLRPQPPSPESGSLPQEQMCFSIQSIRLEGPDTKQFSWLSDQANEYLNQCLGVQGVNLVVRRLTDKLIERGYVTSKLSLPPQNLSSGQLLIKLHLGRIEAIHMVQDGVTDTAWGDWRNAMPISAGDVLNIRPIEQGLEQMKRLASQDVATELAPGQEPDTSVLTIRRRSGPLKDRIHSGFSLDNTGTPALGRAQLGGTLSLDNPLGWNDLLALSLNSNAQRPGVAHRSQSASLSYSIPWGYSLFSLSANRTRFAQEVQGSTVMFLSSGQTHGADFKWQYNLWRDASSKLSVVANVSARRANSFLDDVELVVQRRRTTNAELGVNYKRVFEQSVFELELSRRKGVGWAGAEPDLPGASAGGATLRPGIWQFNANFSTDFKWGTEPSARPISYSLSARGQGTRQTLVTVDQYSIGNRYSVRGFDGAAVLMAENGLTLRNEWTTPAQGFKALDAHYLLAADWGRTWGPSAPAFNNRLLGVALGLRGRWQRWQFDLSAGTPVLYPTQLHSHRLNPYLSVNYLF